MKTAYERYKLWLEAVCDIRDDIKAVKIGISNQNIENLKIDLEYAMNKCAKYRSIVYGKQAQ